MVLEKNLNIMCSEVLEILKYCPKSDVNKIPMQMIKLLNDNKDINYKVDIDPNKSIFNQSVSEETLVLIFMIFRDYWANDQERKEIDEILNENELKINEFYDYDNMFNKNKVTHKKSNTSNEMIEYKESFISKAIKVIKKYFNK